MGEKFKGNYRIESARKRDWDYSWDGMYLVTIYTGAREPYFVLEMAKLAVSTMSAQPNNNRHRTTAASEKWKPGALGTDINQCKLVVTMFRTT